MENLGKFTMFPYFAQKHKQFIKLFFYFTAENSL